MRSATCDLQNAIRIARIYWRTSTLRAALAQPFHCLFPTTFLDSTLLNLYPYPTATLPLWCSSFNALVYSIRTFTLPYYILLISPLLYATLLCSTLLYPTQLYSTSTLPLPTSTHYSASTLPLLSFYSTFTSASTSPLANSCLPYATVLHSTSTLHLLYLFSTTSTLPLHRCQLDTMISGLVRMWLHDLLTQVPTGHNDLCASETVTSWSLNAGANWTQWSLG